MRTEAIAPRGGYGGGYVRPKRNLQGNQGNRDDNGNDQRQGRVFALMPRDVRNNEIVVVGNVLRDPHICLCPHNLPVE